MNDLKKKQMIIRFDDSTPDGGVYKFILTSPIDDAVYVDWAGSSAGLVGRYVNIAEFENNGQTTANITEIEVDEPAIPEPPIAEPPAEPEIAPNFNASSKAYVKNSVVRADSEMSNYWKFNHLEFSTPGAGEDGTLPGAAWANITDQVVAPYTAFLYSPTKVYKNGDFVLDEEGQWWKYNGATGTAGVPSDETMDWLVRAHLGADNTFDEAFYYTLGAANYADPIVRVDVGDEETPEYQYWKHSYFAGIEGTQLISPTGEYQTAWSPFTPYVKKRPIIAPAFIPYIPPALPRTSLVAGKYWRFITNAVNSEVRPLPENLIEPKTYKTLSVRVFNLNGTTYTADEGDYLILNTWSRS